jgi:hypothetical protein
MTCFYGPRTPFLCSHSANQGVPQVESDALPIAQHLLARYNKDVYVLRDQDDDLGTGIIK